MNGHKGWVKCVKWVHAEGLEKSGLLVSASVDSNICLWRWNGESGRRLSVLQGCPSGVTAIALHSVSDIDGFLHLHLIACCAHPEAQMFQCSISENDDVDDDTRSFGGSPKIVHHSVAITPVLHQSNSLLIALGGMDGVVRLFSSDGAKERLLCKLGGHDDWIRGLAFKEAHDSKLLLASASQDRFVRVWALTTEKSSRIDPLEQLAPSKRFSVGRCQFTVKCEGLLTGHEDRVHTVAFHPDPSKLQLLSASMDRKMFVWQWDAGHRCWEQTDSVGDAGCSSLGYFGGVYAPNGSSIVAHGFTGALHMWQEDKNGWKPVPSSTGHYGPVMNICSSLTVRADGLVYVVSVGKDQTTRLWTVMNGRLQEIARPQVHGHDFHSVAIVPNRQLDTVVTCSEEKVIRVFAAGANFYRYLRSNGIIDDSPIALEKERVAYGASIKALALTNTAMYEGDDGESERLVSKGIVDNYTPGPDFAPNAAPMSIIGMPLEEHLSQNTLWPETQKLYGHGDVVYSLAASPCGQWLASACKAQKEDTAVIFVWNTTTWMPSQKLRGHTLTVTRMAFSSDGGYLLSGSRDRTFCLFENGDGAFRLFAKKAKAHARVIWDVSWMADNVHFATASRDQTVKIWRASDVHCIQQVSFESGITAICFNPNKWLDSDMLAVGQESGIISIWSIHSKNAWKAVKEWDTTENQSHADAVHRLLWIHDRTEMTEWRASLMSCSADHSIRLFRIRHKAE